MTNDLKCTDGPWHVRAFPGPAKHQTHDIIAGHNVIATTAIMSRETPAEALANANMMAASRDLYDALARARSILIAIWGWSEEQADSIGREDEPEFVSHLRLTISSCSYAMDIAREGRS